MSSPPQREFLSPKSTKKRPPNSAELLPARANPQKKRKDTALGTGGATHYPHNSNITRVLTSNPQFGLPQRQDYLFYNRKKLKIYHVSSNLNSSDPLGIPSFQSSETNSVIDEPLISSINRTKIASFNNDFPSYNANTLSKTLLQRRKNNKSDVQGMNDEYHSDLLLNAGPNIGYIDSNDVFQDSSDVGYNINDTTDNPTSEFELNHEIIEDDNDEDESGSENFLDDYIRNENNGMSQLNNPFDEDDTLISENQEMEETLDVGLNNNANTTIEDLDKTPIFKRRSSLTSRSLSLISKTPFWRTPERSKNSRLAVREDNHEPSFKLDPFGRVTSSFESSFCQRGSSSDDMKTEEDKFYWNSDLTPPDSDVNEKKRRGDLKDSIAVKKVRNKSKLKSNSFTHFKVRTAQDPDANTSKFESVNARSGSLNRLKSRSFTRTNSTTEQGNLRFAKNTINAAIDDATPVVQLEKLELQFIPDEIEDLNKLICVNPLSSEIYQPLLEVYLSNNVLQEINPRLFDLRNLSVLSLRNNKIRNIPGKVRDLGSSLKYLQISGNKILWLPSEIIQLENLQTLSVRPNPKLLEFSEYVQLNKVLKVIYGSDLTLKRSPGFGNSKIAVKKFIGELKLNPNSIRGMGLSTSISDFSQFLCSLEENSSIIKLPKLSTFCLKKFENYYLSMTEIKNWYKALSKRHKHMLESTLKGLVNEKRCYSCHHILVYDDDEKTSLTTQSSAIGSILEYYDICDIKLVPVLKEFCCLNCVKKYLKLEVLNDVVLNDQRGYHTDGWVNENMDQLIEKSPPDISVPNSSEVSTELQFNAEF